MKSIELGLIPYVDVVSCNSPKSSFCSLYALSLVFRFSGFGEFHRLLFAPAFIPPTVLLEDVGNSEHDGDMQEPEENEERPINFSQSSSILEPLHLKVDNLEPKNLVKREMVDKRKPARPRKLPESLTISSIGSHCADFKLSLTHHLDTDVPPPDFEAYKALMEQHSAVFDTPDQDQKPMAGKGMDGGRSVRQYCIKVEGNLFRCSVCSRTYTHISNFCRHFITTHKGVKQEVPCPICGKLFTRKDNMVTHTKMVHRLMNLSTQEKSAPLDTAPPQP